MSRTETGLVELSHDECARLLTAHRPRLGRLAFMSGGRVLIFPMNFVAVGNLIYFRPNPAAS